MKRIVLALLAISAFTLLRAQKSPEAYVLFDQDGRTVEYAQLIEQMSQMDVVFLGEIHNCPIAHWMEKLIVEDLYAVHGDALMLGAEMFERDDQLLVDEYVGGLITESRFKVEAKLWDNYATDYAPILEFAKEKSLPFVATNVPRRYANMVSKGGFEALEPLSDEARALIAPLPLDYIPNPLVDAFFARMTNPMKKVPSDKLSKAQAIKDATMAWSISQRLKGKMVHLNGSFHSTGHAGILSYLNAYRPGLKIGTVEVVRQEKIDALDETNKGKADFFICVPESMTTTY